MLLRIMHGREDVEMKWWGMCQIIDALRMMEEKYERADEIGEIQGEKCPLDKNEILFEMNEEDWKLFEIEMSRNVSKKVIGFNARYKKRGGAQLVDGSIV